ncbi:FAD-dependent oxidoreductase [Glutamicibacter sp. M10]|uniref:FAD-dependent oxidoreductase n=1 Tax=Glutamicibacter sp. M10 TaxID=3023076 RepID=UPI0037BED0F4
MEQHIGIIGGGILGIAIARAITLQTGYRVSVIEKESLLASHQTGRNSGVVHAGLYYQPGSLKAQLCARGKALTREYCQEHALPYRALGKLVVALGDDQLGRLADMEQRAIANQVPGLARLSRDELVQIEPHVSGVAALHSPQTAAVDYGAITRSMATEIEAAGGQILLNSEVTAVKVSDQICLVSTKESTYRFDQLIVCAGLQSDVIARMVGADPSPKILPSAENIGC